MISLFLVVVCVSIDEAAVIIDSPPVPTTPSVADFSSSSLPSISHEDLDNRLQELKEELLHVLELQRDEEDKTPKRTRIYYNLY